MCCASNISRQQAIWLIGSFLDHMGNTPYNQKGDRRRSATLRHFANAAAFFLNKIMREPFSMFTSTGGKQVQDKYIALRLSTFAKWDTKRPKREPYTIEMFNTFHAQVESREAEDAMEFLGPLSLVFDTQCLGIFTGSRVSEYAQSKGARTMVSRVPRRRGDSTPGPALPIAFVRGDFEFLSAEGTTIPHAQDGGLRLHEAVQLNVLFRYDKSGRNYEIRKFGRGNGFLCPITAARRLLRRAHMLGIPNTDPICAYRDSTTSTHHWLRDHEVTDTMRFLVDITYEDENHFLRVNRDRLASHSNRVTAAVALSQTGMSHEDIAQRLRWKVQSVSFYLRESARDVNAFTANTIAGAQRAFTPYVNTTPL